MIQVKKGAVVMTVFLFICIVFHGNAPVKAFSNATGTVIEGLLDNILKEVIITATPPSIVAVGEISTGATTVTTVERTAIIEEELQTEKQKKKDRKVQKKFISLAQYKKKMKQGMDISKPSGLSKKDFKKLVKHMKYDYTGVFKRGAGYIWELAQKFQFDEVAFLGIMAQESKWGSYKPAIKNKNYTAQLKKNGKLISYKTEKQCLKKTAKNLGKNYLRKKGKYYHGKSLWAVNKTYCSPVKVKTKKGKEKLVYTWHKDVYKCMKMIVG